MQHAAQPEERERRRAAAQNRRVERPLPVAARNRDDDGEGEEREAAPLRKLQRAVEPGLQRVVQRYFPFIAKYISRRPSRITNATADAMGPWSMSVRSMRSPASMRACGVQAGSFSTRFASARADA